MKKSKKEYTYVLDVLMDSFAIVDDEGKLKVFPDAMFDSKKGKYVEIVKIIDLKIKI